MASVARAACTGQIAVGEEVETEQSWVMRGLQARGPRQFYSDSGGDSGNFLKGKRHNMRYFWKRPLHTNGQQAYE